MTAASGGPPFRAILVGTDFSDCSAHAVQVAAALARASGGTLTVLHVQEPGALTVLDGALLPSAGELAAVTVEREAALARVIDALRADGVVATPALALGAPAEQLVAQAQAGGHDLVVVGTHGRTGLSHVVLGSVAEQVVRRASCPVLSIRTARR